MCCMALYMNLDQSVEVKKSGKTSFIGAVPRQVEIGVYAVPFMRQFLGQEN